MNPIVKVLIAAALFCLALYYGIAFLLGSTNELEESLDVKSLSYIREDDDTSRVKPEIVVAPDEALAGKSDADPGDVPALETAQAPERVVPADSLQADRVHAATAETEIESLEESARQTDSSAKRLKETLNVVEPPPPVRAVDVAFEIPANCDASDVVLAPLSVKYRYESPSIKGESIGELQSFAAEYHRCEGGIFRLSHNPLGREDSTPMLMQRRLDEIKYFFLQHRVPKSALKYPDNS
ncbi:hypothetical protein [Granulosicoccus antarcticus]|uniref:Uncharacterized protein n=1 Tax=Granulosicoccus antarcticus IMCC3135 TaxID=1192854 RepID=A0A2Z2NJY6_9GAMM|nr:hypothetical protein [Granulosicoccus antarcticus]ASJ71433.1 hypothetical protein IMCC3135_06630 [Granulosicoccus antarcticus IMCC3135]